MQGLVHCWRTFAFSPLGFPACFVVSSSVCLLLCSGRVAIRLCALFPPLVSAYFGPWVRLSAWLVACWQGVSEVACVRSSDWAEAAVGLHRGWAAASWAAWRQFSLLAFGTIPPHSLLCVSASFLVPLSGSLVPNLFLTASCIYWDACDPCLMLLPVDFGRSVPFGLFSPSWLVALTRTSVGYPCYSFVVQLGVLSAVCQVGVLSEVLAAPWVGLLCLLLWLCVLETSVALALQIEDCVWHLPTHTGLVFWLAVLPMVFPTLPCCPVCHMLFGPALVLG